MFNKSYGRMLGVLAAMALAGGCVSAEQVEDIVNESNRTIVVASIRESSVTAVAGSGANLDPEPGSLDDATWQQAVARIEEFIDDHPGEILTINALRMREAVVLLNAGQPNLARAVFSEVDRAQLGNERDRAIYDAREHLIWWYGLGSTMSDDDRGFAKDAMDGIADVANDLVKESHTRRYLEETRVRIALRVAQTFVTEAQIREVLDGAIERYAAQFDTDAQTAIQVWRQQQDLAAGAALRSLRWYDYAPKVFEDADNLLVPFCADDCDSYEPPWIACIEENRC